ncbi:MAG: translocation/assembly module TamB domain-containing protein, partial [Polyangiaceae bacterium]
FIAHVGASADTAARFALHADERPARRAEFERRVRDVAALHPGLARTIPFFSEWDHTEGFRVTLELLLDGIELSVDTQFDGRLVEAEAALTVDNPLRHEDDEHPCAGRVMTLTLEDAETALPGPLLDPATWRGADYEGMIGLESVKLRCLADVWQEASPLAPIPITEVAGVLDASFGVAVDADDPFPSLTHVGLRTTGLVVAGRPTEPEAAPPWKTDELDVAVVGSLRGATGDATLSVALLDDDQRVADNLTRPPLVRLDAAMALDLDALVAGGERARTSLENTKLSVALETSRSPWSRWTALPMPWRELPSQIGGDVEVDVYLEGTPRDPSIAGRARAWGLRPPRLKDRPNSVTNDLDVMVSYQGSVGRVDGTLHRDGELALEISGESQGNLSTRLLGGGADPRWTGWVRAELEGMQLSTVPPLAKLGMQGNVTGRLEVRGLGEDPHASVDLSIDGLGVGPKLRFGKSKVRLRPLGEGKGGLGLLVELPLEGGGGLRVSGYGGLDWEDQLYPKPAVDRAAGLYVIADRFPLATARPFVPDSVAGLAGSLSGELRVGYKEKSTTEVSVDADLWLRDGAAQLVPLGQDFHGITAHVLAKNGLVTVNELELRSGTGRATGSLRAGLDGLGLNVVTGSIQIDESEPFPIASEGVPLGNVTGTVDANVSVRDDGVQALLVTRGVRLQLPPSANQDVQELEAHPDVEIAQPLYAPKPDEDEEGGRTTPVTLTIVLSPTEIVGNQVRIAFLTEAPLTVRNDGVIKGEIVVTGGELTVLDKTFRVDRGRVLLREEEPGNPFLNVTAHWDAPDGTTVYVDYVGPLKPMDRENFTFRSQPAMPESEVLALLIFGDASAGAAGTDQTNSVANSVAAAQFNAVLGQLAPGLSTKISTSSATLTYQLTDKVTLSATFENQQGAAGQQQGADTASSGGNPNDATNRSEFSIGYRFAKSWLVRGTVGVGLGAASGIDLLFQHRY